MRWARGPGRRAWSLSLRRGRRRRPAGLIRPHGGALVDRTGDRPDGFDELERVVLTSRELSDLELLACGALSPLEGFMGRDDYESVLESMRLVNGLPWALPVCLACPRTSARRSCRARRSVGRSRRRARRRGAGTPTTRSGKPRGCFSTTEAAHPGVARLYDQRPLYLAGRVTVFGLPEPAFPELAKTPAETRAEFAARGWRASSVSRRAILFTARTSI